MTDRPRWRTRHLAPVVCVVALPLTGGIAPAQVPPRAGDLILIFLGGLLFDSVGEGRPRFLSTRAGPPR